ncbi:nucleoside triphosphate pyrophosphohydrolase [Hyphomicrobium sp.]|uniref:nucleoside triphosphate pyrophosphohydrolase n=1 Tax=Hyphomicrobium sp. TaxID=82 RepID=UPI002FDEBA4A
MTPSKDIARLIEIMAALRTPVTGCPWDLEQTFATIAPYTIEEAYEVADAIASGDRAELRDELGDLLLQVVYHARMAEEEGAFAFGDVVEAITAKMIRRHPHVFGTEEERAAGAEPGFWSRIKAEERAAKEAVRNGANEAPASAASSPLPTSRRGEGLLADVSLALPALTRAVKLQDKAARVGFDWPSLAPVFDKMREELGELEREALPSDPRGAAERSPDRMAKIEEEFGDLLFVMANVARHLRLDPETALRSANRKFERRFRHIEARLAEQGRTPEESTLEEMDALWDEAKEREGDR